MTDRDSDYRFTTAELIALDAVQVEFAINGSSRINRVIEQLIYKIERWQELCDHIDYDSDNLLDEYNKKILDLTFEIYKRDVEIACLKEGVATKDIKLDSSLLAYPSDMSYDPNS